VEVKLTGTSEPAVAFCSSDERQKGEGELHDAAVVVVGMGYVCEVV